MKKGVVTGILVVLGVVITIVNPMIMGLLAIPTWVYLVWMVGKGKLHDQIDLIFTKRQLRMFKNLMKVAGIAFIFSLVGILLHNLGPDLLGLEEKISFYIGIAAAYIFIFATTGGLILFLTARQNASL